MMNLLKILLKSQDLDLIIKSNNMNTESGINIELLTIGFLQMKLKITPEIKIFIYNTYKMEENLFQQLITKSEKYIWSGAYF